MSAADQERTPEREQRSSVEIDDRWKGEEPAVKVKLYDGCTDEEAARLRKLAVTTFLETRQAVRA